MKIGDNILLCREFLHSYHKDSPKEKKYAINLDLMKAYDFVRWDFIFTILKTIGLHPSFLKWIENYVTAISFLVCLNNELVQFFKRFGNFRLGDLISLYLFVIGMKMLAKILKKEEKRPSLNYHWSCKENKITHLCFVNDLILFCKAETDSVLILGEVFNSFYKWSSLKANHTESNMLFSSVSR